MSNRGRESNGVQNCSAANHNHIAATIEIGFMKDFQHPLNDMNVILDGFAPWNNLEISVDLDAAQVAPGKQMNSMSQLRIRIQHTLINPELDSRNTTLRSFQQFDQHILIVAEDIASHAKSMSEADSKVHIDDIFFLADR